MTPAAGSTFADGSTDAKTLTTGADGTDELVAQLVVGNSYVIEETKAPSGYVTIDGSMTVTVRDDGSIRIADGTTAPTEFVVTEDNTVQVFTGTVTNDPTKLTVNKVDATTNRALSGATFTLTGTFADGSTEQTLSVTGEATGSVELDKAPLIADGQTEYTLRETVPPAGFERIQEDFTFIVATDGAITPTGTPDGWTLGNDEHRASPRPTSWSRSTSSSSARTRRARSSRAPSSSSGPLTAAPLPTRPRERTRAASR